MQFGKLAEYLEKLEKTASRLEITAILTRLFGEASSEEIDKLVYLSLGELAPSYRGVILNLAEKMMERALSLAYSVSLEEVKKEYKRRGDLGNVAESLAKYKVQSTKYSVTDVYKKLLEVARDNGEGSQDRKIEKMADLLNKLDPLSNRFVARIPVGKLRLGFSEKTVLDALGIDEDEYNVHPDIGYIAKLVKENKLGSAAPEIGVPVVPMLAQRLNSTTEMIKKMGEVSVEPKFDGLRIFIHFRRRDGLLKIFTRNMNAIDITTFPELSEVGKYIKADEVILDTEAVGLDEKREGFLDFQKTIQRRRKHDIAKNAGEIPLQFQVFDILLVDGINLINEPYINRRRILKDKIINGKLLKIDENTITKDPEMVKKLHEKYLKMGLEGVVVKRASGHYVSGRTGWNWVKMKEEEGMAGRLADTIDCVVMGYSLGKGKRTQFGLGKILVGIRDGDTIRTLTKVGTGLTEKTLVEMKKRIDNVKSRNIPKEYKVDKDLVPDVWAHPSIIVEIAADSISKSTKHSLGISLRFPRFIKFRDDKSVNDATTLDELK